MAEKGVRPPRGKLSEYSPRRGLTPSKFCNIYSIATGSTFPSTMSSIFSKPASV